KWSGRGRSRRPDRPPQASSRQRAAWTRPAGGNGAWHFPCTIVFHSRMSGAWHSQIAAAPLARLDHNDYVGGVSKQTRPIMTSPTMSLLDRAGLDRNDARRHLARALEGADDGELFLEYRQAEMLVFDNGRLKQATYDTAQGFGLRAVKDEAVGYAHASDVSEAAIGRAADAVRAVKGSYSGHYAGPPPRTNVKLYGEESPLASPGFEAKARLLETIDAYARAKDPRVRQVSVSVGATWQAVEVVRGDGE